MLNNQWLITFKTLVDVGHFTKTAEKLFMTQPGVSQHIKKLEHSLDTQLLIKIGKKFELTNAGNKVYQYACEQLQQQQALKEAITQDSPHKGECRFAMSGSLSMQFQPAFLERQKKHTQLHISLEAAPNLRIAENLIGNQIDVGLMTQRLPTEQLDYDVIGHEQLCLVLPKKHELNSMSISTLIQLGVIDHPDCQLYLSQILRSHDLDKSQSDIPINGYINQLSQILYPVVHGLGFTVLPLSAVNAFPLQNKITIAQLPQQSNETIYLVTKKNRPIAKRYHWFIDTIKNTF